MRQSLAFEIVREGLHLADTATIDITWHSSRMANEGQVKVTWMSRGYGCMIIAMLNKRQISGYMRTVQRAKSTCSSRTGI
jgi:hypothetical protein